MLVWLWLLTNVLGIPELCDTKDYLLLRYAVTQCNIWTGALKNIKNWRTWSKPMNLRTTRCSIEPKELWKDKLINNNNGLKTFQSMLTQFFRKANYEGHIPTHAVNHNYKRYLPRWIKPNCEEQWKMFSSFPRTGLDMSDVSDCLYFFRLTLLWPRLQGSVGNSKKIHD